MDFNRIEEETLKLIIKRLTAYSGVKVYRSCKYIQKLVDRVKPKWTIPDSTLCYSARIMRREFYRSVTDDSGRRFVIKSIVENPQNINFNFFKIELVRVLIAADYYYNAVVRPELESMAAVGTLSLDTAMSDEFVRQFTASARTAHVQRGTYFGPDFDIFQRTLLTTDIAADPSWNDTKIFNISKNLSNLIIVCESFYDETISSFCENSLNYGDSKSLKTITFKLPDNSRLHKVPLNVAMENILMKLDHRCPERSYKKISEGEYKMEEKFLSSPPVHIIVKDESYQILFKFNPF